MQEKDFSPKVIMPFSFLLTAVIGIVVIFNMANDELISKIFTGSTDPLSAEYKAGLIILACCLLFLLHFVTVTLLHRIFNQSYEILTNREFQNSFYFLGFIFTLASIAITVYLLGGVVSLEGNTGGELKSKMRETLTENAIALSTTIIGMMIRNMLAYRYPPEEVTFLPDLKLLLAETNEAATSLKTGIGNVTQRLSNMTHALEEVTKSASWDNFKAHLDNIKDNVNKAAEEMVKHPIKTEDFWKEYEDVVSKLKQEMEAMTRDAASTAKAIGDFSANTILASNIASERIHEALGQANLVLQNAQGEAKEEYLQTLQQLKDNFKEVHEAISNTVSQIKVEVDRIPKDMSNALSSTSGEWTKTAEPLTQKLIESFSELKNGIDSLKAVAATAPEDLSDLTSTLSAIKENMGQVVDGAKDVNSALVETAEVIRQSQPKKRGFWGN